MGSSRRDKLVGVVVSLPTFNDEDFNLELKKEKRHIHWLIEHGLVEGNGVLMIAGGLGEGYFLDDDEWRALADCLVESVEGRVPTAIGVFELSARRAAKKAQYAADAGIDFLQFAPPRYMVPSDDDVFGHYKYVNDTADIGIMAYNTPWAMPGKGFEFGRSLLERFTTLENVVGIKWSSFSIKHYAEMLRLFSDKFNFINNGGILELGPRLGMKGFIDFSANVAPARSLQKWQMIKEKRFDELDNLAIQNMDAFLSLSRPEEAAWVGMGEGPTARLRLKSLGLDSGPPFPAQAPLSPEYVEAFMRGVEASGALEHVEWDASIFDGIEAEAVGAMGDD
jgi:dihydrodipicolinate synthase/N-acetylneuraminate lyase